MVDESFGDSVDVALGLGLASRIQCTRRAVNADTPYTYSSKLASHNYTVKRSSDEAR
jgi:hypothetical protein